MEKIINLLINNWTKGVDSYTHNGSTWLIFTEQKSWVIELTESKTLWYNYNFFKELFSLTSMDVVDNQHYITKWVEDNIINKVKDTILEKNITEGEVEEIIENGVKHTVTANNHIFDRVEDAIQNGVKETSLKRGTRPFMVKDTIQNGVKETNHVDVMKFFDNKMENAIQNGVKETQFNSYENKSWVEGVIKGGVKHTEYGDWLDGDERLDEIVENGVKETIECDWNIPKYVINEVIIEGVKETNHVDVMKFFDNKMEDTLKNGVRHTLNTEYMPTSMVEDIIQNGVKETKTPGKDGDILSTIEWMEENKSTSYTKMIDDVIDNGVKEVVSYDEHKRGPVNTFGYIDDIIKEGEKINGTYAGGQRQSEKCKSVVEYGTKNPSV
jgi:hypothetical protein